MRRDWKHKDIQRFAEMLPKYNVDVSRVQGLDSNLFNPISYFARLQASTPLTAMVDHPHSGMDQ